MLKMFVTKAVKAAWDNAGTASTQEPTAGSTTDTSSAVEESPERVEVAVTAESLGIELPFYPGQGTSCGAECRCSWQIDVRWSPNHGTNATYVSWVTSGDGSVCPDCEARAHEWNNELIRLEDR